MSRKYWLAGLKNLAKGRARTGVAATELIAQAGGSQVGVDLGAGQLAVTEQLLNVSNGSACLEQMGSASVAQLVQREREVQDLGLNRCAVTFGA